MNYYYYQNKKHQPIRSKYGNRIVEYDGYKFDSQGESMRYYQLKMLQKAGKISGLQVHVPFELIPKDGKHRAIYYEADFVYIEDGQKIVEDFKGFRTDVYKIKKRMMKWLYDIDIRETSDKDLGKKPVRL